MAAKNSFEMIRYIRRHNYISKTKRLRFIEFSPSRWGLSACGTIYLK